MGVPQPIQARAESTVSAVIAATVRAIEEGGESNVRIDEILVETGISKGSLYHHFGGREGLIAAARVVQFSRFIESDVQQIHEALTAATTLDEYVAAASHLLEVGEGVERQKVRLARLNTISSSYGRSDLWNALSVQQHAHTELIAKAIRHGQTHGWIRNDLDARAISVFVQGYALSRILIDLDTDPVPTQDWEAVVRTALGALFVTPE
jgi:AcrR family transcriptional regulator